MSKKVDKKLLLNHVKHAGSHNKVLLRTAVVVKLLVITINLALVVSWDVDN